jgi:S-adenosylmethionine:diacylglycerol 3-amino-3-carboxypropyl transferase
MTSNTTSGTMKIDRVVNEYGLAGMGDELEERWLGTNETEQSSTRELADYFNKEILRSAIRESDTFTLSGDVEEVYRALDDDESADATLVRSRLEQSAIDVEAVTSDFISHQTVHRYLKEHREVERPERDPERKLADAVSVVQQLQGRTIAVTEQKIETLKNNDIVSVGEFSVLNDVQVICESCGRSHEVTSFFEQGGCGCDAE